MEKRGPIGNGLQNSMHCVHYSPAQSLIDREQRARYLPPVMLCSSAASTHRQAMEYIPWLIIVIKPFKQQRRKENIRECSIRAPCSSNYGSCSWSSVFRDSTPTDTSNGRSTKHGQNILWSLDSLANMVY